MPKHGNQTGVLSPEFSLGKGDITTEGEVTVAIRANPSGKAEVKNSGEPWELINGSRMNWRNVYDEGMEYELYDVARDGEWTMVANKTTTDRPAPQPNGDPEYSMDEGPSFGTQNNTSVIYSGHLYTITEGGWIRTIRVWVPSLSATTNYRFIVINETDPANLIIRTYEEPVLVAGQWNIIAVGSFIVTAGVKIRIVIDALNTGSSTNVSGGWGYDGKGTTPASQRWSRNSQQTIVHIHKTDLDTTDRTTELLGATLDTHIRFVQTSDTSRYYEYLVTTTPIDSGAYVTYGVILVGNGAEPVIGQACTLDMDIPVPSATDYSMLASHWPTNNPDWATVEGFLEYNGVSQPGNDVNAFGVDLNFQKASISLDWDLLATSSVGASGGGSTGINFDYIDYNTGLVNPTHKEGRTFWDDATKSLALYTDRPDVTLNIGFEMWKRVTNDTGDPLSNGQIVSVTGWLTGNPTITVASNNNLGEVESVVAMLTEDIDNAETGIATTMGRVNDLDTDGETSGAIVWLGLDGNWTVNRPAPPNYEVRIGSIGEISPTTGSIEVNIVGFNSTDTDVNSEGMLNGIFPQRQGVTFLVVDEVIYADIINEQFPTTKLPLIVNGVMHLLNTLTGSGVGGAARVALTEGTVNLPAVNFIYVEIIASVPTLKASVTYPTATHIAIIGVCSVFDDVSTLTDGVWAWQRFNNAMDNGPGDGFMQYTLARIRRAGADWQTGVLPTVSLVGTSPTSVNVTHGPGLVWQAHNQEFVGTDGSEYWIVNHPTENVKRITDLNEIDVLSTGVSLSNNDIIGINLQGSQSSPGGVDRTLILLPDDTYVDTPAGVKAALADSKPAAITSIPSGIGANKITFRTCRLVLRYNSGNTWDNVVFEETGTYFQDERGLPQGASSGGGAGGPDEDAIHDNVAGEINAITKKTTPVGADVIIIEDSADSFNKKGVLVSNLPGGGGGTDPDAIHDNVAGEINAIAAKADVSINDVLVLEDSEDSYDKKSAKVSDFPGRSLLQTCSMATLTYASIDVYGNNATYGGLVSPSHKMVITGLKCWCTQSSGGDVQGAVYDASTNTRIGLTDLVSVSTTGFKTLTLTAPLTLTNDKEYYLAIACTGNGSRFAGRGDVASSWNPSIKPSFRQLNQRVPATINPSQYVQLVWIKSVVS